MKHYMLLFGLYASCGISMDLEPIFTRPRQQSIGIQFFNAIKSQCITEIKDLLNQHPEVINERYNENATPLHIAARIGNVDIAKIILEHDVEQLLQKTTTGLTILHCGASSGKLAMVRYLIDQDMYALYTRNNNNHLPIHYSLSRGDHESVECFLQYDVLSPEEAFEYGLRFSPLNVIVHMLNNHYSVKRISSETWQKWTALAQENKDILVQLLMLYHGNYQLLKNAIQTYEKKFEQIPLSKRLETT